MATTATVPVLLFIPILVCFLRRTHPFEPGVQDKEQDQCPLLSESLRMEWTRCLDLWMWDRGLPLKVMRALPRPSDSWMAPRRDGGEG